MPLADTAMKTTELAGTVSPIDVSLLGLISHADAVVKIVMLGLFVASIWGWAIIIDKWFRFRYLGHRMDRFERIFWSGQVLSQLYEKIKNRADHPMALVFVAAMQEWTRLSAHQKPVDPHLIQGTKERMYQAMELACNREMGILQRHIGFLATISSAAPFIGLFGTVWGIMNSFQSIAATKNTTLAVVAPGIAEALLATAVGLAAAIPAAIFYNYISSQLNQMWGRVEDFSAELGALLSRELDEGN